MLRNNLHCLRVILRPVEHLINPGVFHPSKRYRVDCVCRTKLHVSVAAGWKGKEFMTGRIRNLYNTSINFETNDVRALSGIRVWPQDLMWKWTHFADVHKESTLHCAKPCSSFWSIIINPGTLPPLHNAIGFIMQYGAILMMLRKSYTACA